MASGKQHEKINLYFLCVLLIILLYFFIKTSNIRGDYFLVFPLIVGYLFGTYFFGPDLDIKSRPTKRWGVLKFLWIPYRKLFKHRSIFTHGIIIGDILRIIYLFLIFLFPSYLIICLIFKIDLSMNHFSVFKNIDFIFICIGIILSSSVHTITDVLYSSYKKNKK